MKAPCLTFPPGWFEDLREDSLGRPFCCVFPEGTDAGGCRCLSPASGVVSMLGAGYGVERTAGGCECGGGGCARGQVLGIVDGRVWSGRGSYVRYGGGAGTEAVIM
jgi:hypothetical protein